MDLTESLQRASLLMSKEGQKLINGIASGVKNNIDSEGNYVKPMNTQTNQSMMSMPMPHQNNMKSNSKLPKAILNSLKNNPINEDASIPVLDKLNIEPILQQQPTYVQETVNYQPQAQYKSTMNIDYNYIRSIVNECIQNNLQQIKEELLKESSLKVVRLGGENKIQLIDNKNNLYESKLEFKRNLNKK
jgi:phosphoenolpyruvate carboxylase